MHPREYLCRGQEARKLAQAIAEVLPEGDKEKQLLQGLLYGRKSYVTAPEARQERMI